MSHLLEILGRGLIGHLAGAFTSVFGGDLEETTESLRKAAAAARDDAEAQLRLAGRYLHEGDPTAARRVFLDVLARVGESLAARLGLACVFDELEQLEVAIEQLRIAQKIDPTNPAVLFCLGYCNERNGHEQEAIGHYQDSLSVCPTIRNSHERLAAIFLRQGANDLAIHHYTRLCELDPDRTDLHLALAGLLHRSGDYETAIRRYEHALTLEPDNWAAHNDVVSAYEEAGLLREAIEHLHKMLESNPEDADTRLRLGDLYARVGNDPASVSHYEKAVQVSPEYLEANVKLGTQHLRAGRYGEAAKWFSFALERNDRLLGAYIGIGIAQHAAGREDEALASLEMARNIEPNSTLLFCEIARMQLKASAAAESGKFLAFKDQAEVEAVPGADGEPATSTSDLLSEQIARLRGAIKRNPNHADLHYRLGLLLKNRGQVEGAIVAFREAIAINPTYTKALIKLGLALAEMEQIDEAIAVLRRAAELAPEYVALRDQLGQLFARRRRFGIAVEHFERALQGNPRNVAFQANLALALQNMGLIDRADATWQIVQDLVPDSAYAEQARTAMAKHRSS